jgi:mannose-6-phosphate isomerase-like protein (cupin superfamily)
MEQLECYVEDRVRLYRLSQQAFPIAYIDLSDGGVFLDEDRAYARIPDGIPRAYLAIISYKASSTMHGRHYHDHKIETLAMISGNATMLVRKEDNGAVFEIDLAPWSILTIEPGIHHALIAGSDVLALEMANSGGLPDETHHVDF